MNKKDGKDGVCPLRTSRTILRAQGGQSKQHVDHSVHASQRACVSHGLPKLPFAQPAVRDSEGHGVEVEHTHHQYEAKLACRNSVSHTHPR